MRLITIGISETWSVPDLHIIFPAIDLWFEHFKAGEPDGTVDSVVIDGRTYKSVFYSERARFFIGDDFKFTVGVPTVINANISSGVVVNIWHGTIITPRQLPAALFASGNALKMIPDVEYEREFCVDCDGVRYTFEDLTGIAIPSLTGNYAWVWFGDTIEVPPTATMIRVLQSCEDAVSVAFILQNGEVRTWKLNIKRKIASYSELTKYSKTVFSGATNTRTHELTDGENEITTTLFISGLRKNELDEISQLAVSRYVVVNGVQVDVVRRSAVISGNSRGGVFTIDVKGSL